MIIYFLLYLINNLIVIFIRLIRSKKLLNYFRNFHNPFLFTYLDKVDNPYISGRYGIKKPLQYIFGGSQYEDWKKRLIYWPCRFNTYIQFNGGNLMFDYLIKNDLVMNALKLPKNYCIIDSGAHIGDGAVPIAHALKYFNRSDVIVYAIEPSKSKCEFIERIKKINKLSNLKVINLGLSDSIINCKPDYKANGDIFRGTMKTQWDKNVDSNESCNFTTIDNLIKDRIISEKIGIIHLDIEGFEYKALKGSQKLLKSQKPYLSIEFYNPSEENIKILPVEYKYRCRLNNNDIYST